MKKWAKIFLLLVIFLAFCGCGRRFSHNSVSSSLVSAISITCEDGDSIIHRSYTSPEKVRLILLAIRSLGPDFPAKADVEAMDISVLNITLDRADGSSIRYQIRGNQFLRKGSSKWRQINSESAVNLFQLILLLPSDEGENASPSPRRTYP